MSDTWWIGEEQLDDEQKDVIGLPLNSSFLVTGPPGCGKTNLLLLRANYMVFAGYPNIAIVVFTRSLQEFIASGGQQYAFPSSKIMTSRRFAQNVLLDAGRPFNPPDGFEPQRTYCSAELQKLIEEEHPEPLYDAVLIDEAQDYLPGEIEAFSKFGRVIFAVADPKQKVYKGADPLETIRKVVGQERQLHHHYRCGINICRLADALGKRWKNYEELTPTSHYDEKKRPSSVEAIRCANLDDMAEKMINKLRVQLQAYPDEWLGVVTPRHEEAEALWARISQSDIGGKAVFYTDRTGLLFKPAMNIFVGTTHSGKGLEFRALHIGGGDYLSRFFDRQRFLAFTAVTRAKTSLSIYFEDALPGFFEKAIQTLKPLPDLPKLKDVFGNKS
jgi:superfamily I DNA and RNA helicase